MKSTRLVGSQSTIKSFYSKITSLAAVLLIAISLCPIDAESSSSSPLLASETQLSLDAIPALSDSVRIFPPLSKDSANENEFDASLLDYLSIRICESEPASQCTGGPQLVPGTSSKNIRLQDDRDDTQYHVSWKTPRSFVDKPLYLRFYVTGLELRVFPYVALNGKAVSIRYAIDNHPRIRARVLTEQGHSGSEIALALLTEFNAHGEVVASMLYVENFGPEAIAIALRDIYQATAQQTADWLFAAGSR